MLPTQYPSSRGWPTNSRLKSDPQRRAHLWTRRATRTRYWTRMATPSRTASTSPPRTAAAPSPTAAPATPAAATSSSPRPRRHPVIPQEIPSEVAPSPVVRSMRSIGRGYRKGGGRWTTSLPGSTQAPVSRFHEKSQRGAFFVPKKRTLDDYGLDR